MTIESCNPLRHSVHKILVIDPLSMQWCRNVKLLSLCDYDNFLQFKRVACSLYIFYIFWMLIKNEYSDNNLTQTFYPYMLLSTACNFNFLCSQMKIFSALNVNGTSSIFYFFFRMLLVTFFINFHLTFFLHVYMQHMVWTRKQIRRYLCDLWDLFDMAKVLMLRSR